MSIYMAITISSSLFICIHRLFMTGSGDHIGLAGILHGIGDIILIGITTIAAGAIMTIGHTFMVITTIIHTALTIMLNITLRVM